MLDPQVKVKANYNRTLVTVRVTGINSPDWVDIVGTRIDLAWDTNITDIFYSNSTTHYKVRAYIDGVNLIPERTVYARVTMTKNDNTTHTFTFNFVLPHPIIGTVVNENGTQYITSIRKMDKAGNLSPRSYANEAISSGAAYIDIMADEAGEMIVTNQWVTAILVQNITQGTEAVEIAGGVNPESATMATNVGDIVRVTEGAGGTTFRSFAYHTNPLCKGVSAHITMMPKMDKFIKTAGQNLVNNLFCGFNASGTLTSLPEGSFDFHEIPTIGSGTASINYLFYRFNSHGALTSLPEGSFNTDVWAKNQVNLYYAFQQFNAYGALTTLPDGSFDFDSYGADRAFLFDCFTSFNQNGALTSLPEGSFGFSSHIDTTITNGYKGLPLNFSYFNGNGQLTSLPAGAFHFKEGTHVPNITYFNDHGALTSLPEHSFNFKIGNINSTGTIVMYGPTSNLGCRNFNNYGALTSLPEGSFQLDDFAGYPVTQYYGFSYLFSNFNTHGALTSLPEGSFNFDMLTKADNILSDFNSYGALTSLPEGSFNFDALTQIASGSFGRFNQGGSLRTLPKGSFGFKNLRTMGTEFASYFNSNDGKLEYLPVGAFSVSGVTAISGSSTVVFRGFNQSGGRLTKSDTDYNPDFILPNVSTSTTAYYYDPSTQTTYTETISLGAPFKYYQTDYFSVSYETSPAYTLIIGNSYLSGETVTFTATATDTEYVATPTVTTEGGTMVAITDNGDGTFTFTMPEDDITVSVSVQLRPATIVLVADEAGNMLVNNRWTTIVIVQNITQGTTPEVIAGYTGTAIVRVNIGDEVTVTEGTASNTFRNWQLSNYTPFVSEVSCHISEMPSMDRFTTTATSKTLGSGAFTAFCAGTNSSNKGKITSLPADSFDLSEINQLMGGTFNRFNYYGSLTSLPAGSFDTSNITTVGDTFFAYFNQYGELTSLPTGSFDISNITAVGTSFFASFNHSGKLTSLPAGSFDTSNITTVNTSFFANFNQSGELTSLPAGSFGINQNLLNASSNFFVSFNNSGKLTSLPTGSFDTSNITTVGGSFFASFNNSGKLTSLPTGSFRLSNTLTTVGNNFFLSFNGVGALTSLPVGSFNTNNITTVGNYFFSGFNQSGKLTSLPAASFDTSNITTVGDRFFASFNQSGALTSLPVGSFGINNITTIGTYFFANFNTSGKLTSLPIYSFNFPGVTTMTAYFFYQFNQVGALTSLPNGSFNTSNITSSTGTYHFTAFNNRGKLESLPANSFSTTNLVLGSGATNSFVNFNGAGSLAGNLPYDPNSYNPNFINPTSNSLTTVYTVNGSVMTRTVSPGQPFYFHTAS